MVAVRQSASARYTMVRYSCHLDSVFVRSFISSHYAGSFGTHSLPHFPRTMFLLVHATTYPFSMLLCHSNHLAMLTDSEITCLGLLYSATLFHAASFHSPHQLRSISLPFRVGRFLLIALRRYPSPSDLNKCLCLLTGIARCTSLGVCGRWWSRTTAAPRILPISVYALSTFPLGQSSKCYPEYFSLFLVS